jgi:superfamily I DNA and/or RNA helicase
MYWVKKFVVRYTEHIDAELEEYEQVCRTLNELHEQEEQNALKTADVIAMTTTCAARYRRSLANIKPKVVIIEEAAEVLEAHVITSLSEGLEHLILIGDHKQLKPNPTVYELAKKYSLEVSLFERMVNNGMQCHTLNIQHRMRPEIALLVRHIYKGLLNHESVRRYENIMGVRNNLVFINHGHTEDEVEHLKSKANTHEAEFTKALCRYFLQQGYDPSRITILTGYAGQLIKLKNIMPKKDFEGVRVTVVDNFQGEENDIIILSLVRSNFDGM